MRALSLREDSEPGDRRHSPTSMLAPQKSGVLAATPSIVGIPVVRDTTAGPGMLNVRQRTWLESFPNESNIENPVLFKYVLFILFVY